MKLNATPETVRNVAETLKMASLLDDRVAKADQARIAAWSEKIETHHLTRDDLLDGLQKFYDAPSERPIGIGDLIHHARIVKRDRLDKEADEERDQRRAEVDEKAAEETSAVAAGFTPGPVKNRTKRLFDAEHALQSCRGKKESIAAIAEYNAAKREASGRKPQKRAS